MGRHRKKPEHNVRRRSVVALSGLVPAGILSATSAASAVDTTAIEQVPEHDHEITTTRPLPVATSTGDNITLAPHLARHAALDAATTTADVDPLPETGPLGVPRIAVAAYQAAERRLAVEQPGCGVSWELLAGIGRVESHHADNGDVDSHGTALHPIYGPALDGSLPGNEVIADGNGGYQRAEGPMQFMPGTWDRYASKGANPQNLFDSAVTAGRYLCDGGNNLRDIGLRTRAILRYNNSMAYVANVMAWSAGYASGAAPAVAALPQI